LAMLMWPTSRAELCGSVLTLMGDPLEGFVVCAAVSVLVSKE